MENVLTYSELKERVSTLNKWLNANFAEDHYLHQAVVQERAVYLNEMDGMECSGLIYTELNCPTNYYSMIKRLEI